MTLPVKQEDKNIYKPTGRGLTVQYRPHDYTQMQVYYTPRALERSLLSYWEDPLRVARYRQVAAAKPPGSSMPDWYDEQKFEQAYKAMEAHNKGKAWWQWDPLPYEDPINQSLRATPAPPPEFLWPNEQKYAPAEQTTLANPAQGGLTEEQFNALPGWKKTMVWLMGQPEIFGTGTGALLGGVSLGGISPVGAVIGAGLGAAAGHTPDLAEKLMFLDYPAEFFERTLGMLQLTYGRAGQALAEGKGFM